MEKITKPVFWTERALKDLQKIYNFNIEIIGQDKAFEIISLVVEKVSILENLSFSYITIGAVDESFSHLKMQYRKLLEGHYKITYREGRSKIYINRIFDTRQHPNKNK